MGVPAMRPASGSFNWPILGLEEILDHIHPSLFIFGHL